MKNIHVLPTDKPSRLYLFEKRLKLGDLTTNPKFLSAINQLIYIINSEEIKEGDWFIALDGTNDIYKADKIWLNIIKKNPNPLQKIILTTDQDLIADGVQAIDNEFLEWFVQNPSCERVDVENKRFFNGFLDPEYASPKWKYKYIITIPKEKTKQETLEEVAANLADPNLCKTDNWIAGAKWQQEQTERMYSKEEVIKIVEKSRETGLTAEYLLLTEQFEKN